MAKFVYIYKGGRRPETEEEGKQVTLDRGYLQTGDKRIVV